MMHGVLSVFMDQVILEIVRLANIVPGIFRKALQDIEFKGSTITIHTCSKYSVDTMTCLNREYMLSVFGKILQKIYLLDIHMCLDLWMQATLFRQAGE